MPLEAGRTLGPYEIVSPIGKGGMGEVYRARDTKLDRDVAIKVLPDELAADEERVARFEREAKLLASLNHPNIASIHGFEESDGIRALVLELVEGPTLAERIEQGPIAIDEAIGIAKQIAEALEAGHEAGVIHRDLKPANIKLKEDGTVKVLDYGLAKALEGEATTEGDSELSQSPTMTRQGTQVGVILGTAAYMSPEQAKGKRVDKRTDIWAFGAVLYEMLTGRKAFAGDDISEVLAAVIKTAPDWSALPNVTPATTHRLLERCLRKDVRSRLRDVGDARVELEEGSLEPTAVEETRSTAKLVPSLVLAAAAGALLTWLLNPGETDTIEAVVRATLELPSEQTLTGYSALAISRDGKRVAYTASSESGARSLYLRDLDTFASRLIPGTEGADAPFFSPDGQNLGYTLGSALMSVGLSGGEPVTICDDCANSFGADWGIDDTILFHGGQNGISRIPARGGAVEVVTRTESSAEQYHWFPTWLPGNRGFVFVLRSEQGSVVAVSSIDSSEVTRLDVTEGASQARYIDSGDSGHILFARARRLLALPFDAETLEPLGPPVLIQDGLRERINSGIGLVDFGVSESGSLVYALGPSDIGGRTLVWKDRHGGESPITEEESDYRTPALSPDETLLAYVDREDAGRPDIWILDLARGTKTRFTTQASNIQPKWSVDGAKLAFSSTQRGRMDVYWKPASGVGEAAPVFEDNAFRLPGSWSPDGESLIVTSSSDILHVSLDGASQPLLSSEFAEAEPRLSPDGKWLAYLSNASGRTEAYVTSYPDLSETVIVSSEGVSQVEWSGDSTELYYSTGRAMMVSTISANPTLRASKASKLFDLEVTPSRGERLTFFDVSADGTRFVLVRQAGTASPIKLHFVQNWLQELQSAAPGN